MYFLSLVPCYKCPLLTVVVLPGMFQQLGNERLGWAEAAALKADHVTSSFPAGPMLLCREALPRKADCPGAWSSRLFLLRAVYRDQQVFKDLRSRSSSPLSRLRATTIDSQEIMNLDGLTAWRHVCNLAVTASWPLLLS